MEGKLSHRFYYCLSHVINHLQWKREPGKSAIGSSFLERKLSPELEHMTLSFCKVFVSPWLDDFSLRCNLFLVVWSEGILLSDSDSFYQELQLTTSTWLFHVLPTCLKVWWSLCLFFSLSIPPSTPSSYSLSTHLHIYLISTWQLHPYWLAVIVLEEGLHGTEEEK